jgi:hypothetical protein
MAVDVVLMVALPFRPGVEEAALEEDPLAVLTRPPPELVLLWV